MSNPQPETPTPASAYGASLRRWDWRRALSPTGDFGDAVFRALLFASALLLLLLAVSMMVAIGSNSGAAVERFGLSFLTSTAWNPSRGQFGALPFIYGTVMSSLIALVISVPLSLGVAVFLVEQAPAKLARPLTFLVELLAAIPSVVYGLWGIFVLAPFMRETVGPPLQACCGGLPLFRGQLTGVGLLTGGVILAIMITPIISAVVRDVLAAVPVTQREAALALGAPQWKVTTGVVLPAAAS
ncbi:MAG TPA: phosphate ABC transporter permease subunit PstC, partial [Pyrinomonadaceae bacterium]